MLLTGTTMPRAIASNKGGRRPNVLLIMTDQQGLDTVSAGGCKWVNTPNLDRLTQRGISFSESYSTNPVCSPARSSIFTGRTTCETGVIKNNLAIRPDIPNLGQWLSKEGYETIYCGKWHLPASYSGSVPGFTVIPGGLGGQGTLGDQAISSACEGYLHNRNADSPFLLVASFLQPHDVCNWIQRHSDAPSQLPFPELENELPPLPPNFKYDPREPSSASPARGQARKWSELQWRYYLWSYYRMVEEVDHEVGRVLNALADTAQADNTLIIFTSDHGEGRGRHQTVTKNFLYDEAAKVPLIMSWPERIPEGISNQTHLVSGLDIMATICDYIGIRPPKNNRGLSVRPLAEGKKPQWREFVVTEVRSDRGRMIRTPEFKYIAYRNDPIQQLFDMESDPGETRNLIGVPEYEKTAKDLGKLLESWESHLDHSPVALPPFKVRAV
jgi:arylsulfatase A-like enzyme